MKIERLKLQNYRSVGETPLVVDFAPDTNLVILLGENGAGKTSVLDAISLCLSSYIEQFPFISKQQFSNTDVHITQREEIAPYLSVEMQCNAKSIARGGLQSETTSHLIVRYHKGTQTPPKSDLSFLRNLGTQLREACIAKNTEVSPLLPIVAYYGTGRGQIVPPQRKRNFQKSFQRWDAYGDALQAEATFKRFFAWFDLKEDEERRVREEHLLALIDLQEDEKRQALKNTHKAYYTLPELDCVRRALREFVGHRFHSPRIKLHPLRFVMSQVKDQTADLSFLGERIGAEYTELRIEQMSDGYKIITAMIGDIAARMAQANPHLENPLESPGVVLIDEIDLHLHPRWQREVLDKLHGTFPNIQFIVTTHSPTLLMGAEKAQVIKLDYANAPCSCNEESSSRYEYNHDYAHYNAGQMLIHCGLFGIESMRSKIWDKDLERRDELLAKATITSKEKQELEELDRKLSQLSVGDSVAALEIFDWIKKNKMTASLQ